MKPALGENIINMFSLSMISLFYKNYLIFNIVFHGFILLILQVRKLSHREVK